MIRRNNRRVQWAWAPEDIAADGGIFSANQQGFQGSLTLPRELFVHEVDDVVDTDGVVAASKEAILTADRSRKYTAQTLGIHPLADVVQGFTASAANTRYSSKSYRSFTIVQRQDARMELKATISPAKGPCRLQIVTSPDMKEYIIIIYEPSNSTILIDRTHRTTIVGFNSATVTGYFMPYTVNTGGTTRQEAITMDVFINGSPVELYINARFALSTRI